MLERDSGFTLFFATTPPPEGFLDAGPAFDVSQNCVKRSRERRPAVKGWPQHQGQATERERSGDKADERQAAKGVEKRAGRRPQGVRATSVPPYFGKINNLFGGVGEYLRREAIAWHRRTR